MAVFTAAVQTRINTFLANLFADVATRQTAYYNGQETVRPASKDRDGSDVPAVTRQRRRYWQGLKLLAADPADGATAAPITTRKPHYQPESWADFGVTLPANSEVNIWCDQYQGPEGDGWVLHVQVQYNGRVWHRSRQHGPETWRTSGGWEDITPSGGI